MVEERLIKIPFRLKKILDVNGIKRSIYGGECIFAVANVPVKFIFVKYVDEKKYGIDYSYSTYIETGSGVYVRDVTGMLEYDKIERVCFSCNENEMIVFDFHDFALIFCKEYSLFDIGGKLEEGRRCNVMFVMMEDKYCCLDAYFSRMKRYFSEVVL